MIFLKDVFFVSKIFSIYQLRSRLIRSMSENFNFDKLSFSIGEKHFEGKDVAKGIGIGLSVAALYGLRQFFKGGWCYIDKDLTGRNVVITGGNGGIGKQTARRLVELGARVFIGSRDQKNNQETVQQLSKIQKGKIIAFRLDLSNQRSISEFAKNVCRQLGQQPLHYLLNNAGIMALPERKVTEKNLQMQIGVNHFGHFYLTYLLWDKLKQSKNPRIVNVSSSAHMSLSQKYNIDFDNLHYQNGGYDSFAAYSRSKKANILFTKELQKRISRARIDGTVVCLHPGAVRTGLQQNYLSSWLKKALAGIFYPLILFTFKNEVQGAQTNLYCLLEEDRNLIKSGYYADCKFKETQADQVQDQNAAKRLWQESEKAFGIQFKI